MKKLFLAVLGVTALAGATTTGMAITTQAEAQKKKNNAPVILLVNQAQLVAQSKAGLSMKEQLETYETSIRADLQGEQKKLEADITSFQKNSELFSPEERQKKGQELQARAQVQLPQMGKIMESTFVQSARIAENKILQEAAPIMQEIVEKRGATILLDRQAVMYAAEETNITQEVLAKLDKKLKTVEVQQVSLDDLRKKAAEAAKNANNQ